jgi:hypothetical protein
MAIERVCVIGAGVIGSLYAGHLARDLEVSVLTRRAEQADALNAHGLRISGKSDFTARVAANADPAGLPDFDFGILATKATQLEEAAALAGRFPGATLMTIRTVPARRSSSAPRAMAALSPSRSERRPSPTRTSSTSSTPRPGSAPSPTPPPTSRRKRSRRCSSPRASAPAPSRTSGPPSGRS